MRASTVLRWSGITVCLLLACCDGGQQQPNRNVSKDAFRQFDPPAPGVANRPLLNMGGKY